VSCVLTISSLFGVVGCHPLDRVAIDIEKYGTVSISAPLLVPVEKARDFDFNLDKSADFYFSAPRVEGAVRLVREQAIDVQFAMKLQIEQMLSTLKQLKASNSAAKNDSLKKKLTEQLLSMAALQQAATGAAGAALVTQNPLLGVGMDAFIKSFAGSGNGELGEILAGLLGLGGEPEQPPGTGPAEVPDQAAPPQTMEEVIADAGPQPDAPEPGSTTPPGGDGEQEPEFKSLLPLARPAKDVLSSPKFSAPLDRYDGPVSISPRQALMLAANDKMTQDLFKWFARPYGFGDNKKAYLCMMTVSCHPGYWTKKNFIADVTVTMEYAKQESPSATPQKKKFAAGGGGGGLPPGSDGNPLQPSSEEESARPPKYAKFSDSFARPLVAAVYPMFDAQVLDLRESLREQIAAATSLAVLGFGGQAELLADFVDRFERDAQTQTAFTVGSAYSAGGYNFGFRIEPRFVAIDKPTVKRGGPGDRLESIQFPAMVLLFVDKPDISDRDDIGGTNPNGYDHIVFHTEWRWLPRDWWTALFWRQTERKMLKRAHRLDEQRRKMNRACALIGPSRKWAREHELEYMTLKRRRSMLAATGLGSTIVSRLPAFGTQTPTTRPAVDYKGWDNAVSTFIVSGSDFSEKTVFGATVGNMSCAIKVLSSEAVLVVCDAPGDKSTSQPATTLGALSLVLATSKGALRAGDVVFNRHYEMETAEARPSVKIRRGKDGNITAIEVTGNFDKAETLLRLVQDSLRCCEDDHCTCIYCGHTYHDGGHCRCKKSNSEHKDKTNNSKAQQ